MRWSFPLVLVLMLVALLLAGCGSKREEVQHREESSKSVTVVQTKTERNAYAPDGTPYIETTITTQTSDTTTRAVADSRLSSETKLQAPELAAAGRVIVGAAAGTNPLLVGALGLFTAGVTAWATHANANSRRDRQRAEEHKADADEGWRKADAYARALPPNTQIPVA